MGNTASFDEADAHKSNEPAAPPKDWNPHAHFHVLSPTSELSNPSVVKKPRAVGTTPMRHRTSKVALNAQVAQQRAERTMLPPEQFYFEVANDDLAPSVEAKKTKKQQALFVRKARRAKRAMLNCMQDTNCRRVDQFKPVRFSNATSARRSSISKQAIHQHRQSQQQQPPLEQPAAPHLQFEPDMTVPCAILREQSIEPYLHNQESFERRVLSMSDNSPMANSLRSGTENEAQESNMNEVSRVMESPVAHLFDKSMDVGDEQVSYDLGCPYSADDGCPYDEHRRSIEQNIQKQIDEQFGGIRRVSSQAASTVVELRRVKTAEEYLSSKDNESPKLRQERIRQQHQEMIQKQKVQVVHATSEPVRVEELSEPESATEADAPGDESRAPNRRSSVTVSTRTTTANKPSLRKSSESNIPVLLQLAGWKGSKNKKAAPDETNVPVLLKLAGWEVRAKKALAKSERQAKQSIESAPAVMQVPTALTERTNAALMLQQTLPIARAASEDPECDREALKRSLRQVKSIDTLDYRRIAMSSPGARAAPPVSATTKESPSVMSMDTAVTTPGRATHAVLSNQAMTNAGFLFSPSYAAGVIAFPSASAPQRDHLIDTFDSRSRLSAHSSKVVSIPGASRVPSIDEAPSRDETEPSDRRVRFSEAEEVIPGPPHHAIAPVVEQQPASITAYPAIESKLSDLTDNTGRRSTSIGGKKISIESIVSLDSVTEERYLPRDEALASPQISFKDAQHMFRTAAPFQPSNTQSVPKSVQKMAKSGVLAARLSELGLTDAVVALPCEASKVRDSKACTVDQQSEAVPIARESESSSSTTPSKKSANSGIVGSRIAALQQRITNGGMATVDARKVRRETTGEGVIAPRKATLQSRVLSTRSLNAVEPRKAAVPSKNPNSPMLVQGKVVGSPEPRSSASQSSSSDGDDDDEDIYGKILKAHAFEESEADGNDRSESIDEHVLEDLISQYKDSPEPEQDDEVDSDDNSVDDFAQMLHYQNSADDETEVASVSTVHRPAAVAPPSTGFSNFASYRVAQFENESVVSGATASTVRPQRLSMATSVSSASTSLSAMGHKAASGPKLAVQGFVRVNEQKGRSPMMARKWRAMAAAAEQRDSRRSLLGERSINTYMGQ